MLLEVFSERTPKYKRCSDSGIVATTVWCHTNSTFTYVLIVFVYYRLCLENNLMQVLIDIKVNDCEFDDRNVPGFKKPIILSF